MGERSAYPLPQTAPQPPRSAARRGGPDRRPTDARYARAGRSRRGDLPPSRAGRLRVDRLLLCRLRRSEPMAGRGGGGRRRPFSPVCGPGLVDPATGIRKAPALGPDTLPRLPRPRRAGAGRGRGRAAGPPHPRPPGDVRADRAGGGAQTGLGAAPPGPRSPERNAGPGPGASGLRHPDRPRRQPDGRLRPGARRLRTSGGRSLAPHRLRPHRRAARNDKPAPPSPPGRWSATSSASSP